MYADDMALVGLLYEADTAEILAFFLMKLFCSSGVRKKLKLTSKKKQKHIDQVTTLAEARDANCSHRIPDSWIPVRI